MKSFTLNPTPPFDFRHSISQVESWPRTYFHAWTGETYFQSLSLDTFSTVFALTWNGNIDKPEMQLDLPDNLTAQQTKEVESVINRQFSMDYDLKRVLSDVHDPKLQALIDKRNGFHPVIFPSPWECIAFSIISSQVSDRLAKRTIENLMEKYGSRVDWQNMDFLCFPRPDEFAKATPFELKELSLSRQKIDYLGGLSSRLAKKELNFNDWKSLSDEELITHLQTIKGIGKYTSAFAVPFGFGRMEAVVPVDGSFRKVLASVYEVPPFSDEEYDQILETWGTYREIALFFVWTEFDDRKREEKKKGK